MEENEKITPSQYFDYIKNAKNEITEHTIVIHNKYNREYKVRDKHLRIKNSTTGEWEDAVTYVPQYPNEEKLFRSK